jgi:crossover junction endodeoxyribonuclease RuvC
MKVLGVDPGLSSGALATYDGAELYVSDVPTIQYKASKKMKTVLNLPELWNILNFTVADADVAYVEQVGAMPGQGVTSMFNFGEAYGSLKAMVVAAGLPITLIAPVKWKSELGMTNDGEKSRARALQLFPKYAHYFSRKMDHNRAEAALIAWYGYMMMTVGKVR